MLAAQEGQYMDGEYGQEIQYDPNQMQEQQPEEDPI
jgi:hypothetical protein